jgi:ABC-type spermidine/putrescine transport system permease subunit I
MSLTEGAITAILICILIGFAIAYVVQQLQPLVAAVLPF